MDGFRLVAIRFGDEFARIALVSGWCQLLVEQLGDLRERGGGEARFAELCLKEWRDAFDLLRRERHFFRFRCLLSFGDVADDGVDHARRANLIERFPGRRDLGERCLCVGVECVRARNIYPPVLAARRGAIGKLPDRLVIVRVVEGDDDGHGVTQPVIAMLGRGVEAEFAAGGVFEEGGAAFDLDAEKLPGDGLVVRDDFDLTVDSEIRLSLVAKNPAVGEYGLLDRVDPKLFGRIELAALTATHSARRRSSSRE